jgi:HAD superfamily hydrolase (TIGR01549 family)
MLMIRWVFFDIGNVVMNDDPVMAFIYSELHRAILDRGIEKGFEDLLSEREQLIRERGAGHWYLLGERYLGLDGLHRLMHHCAAMIRADYMAYHNVLPGMEHALETLSREFELGILANQLKESMDGLEACGLRRYFRIAAVSELLDLKKPDPAIFRWALAQAGCAPEEAVMVGDRIDNDILPARQLGMWTLWFHAPPEEKGYSPTDGIPRLYQESQERASIGRIGPASPEEMPDGEARTSAELVSEVLRLRECSRTGQPRAAKEDAPSGADAR